MAESETVVEIGMVVDNKPFVRGLKEAERQADVTGKRIKEGGERGGQSYSGLSRIIGGTVIALKGLNQVATFFTSQSALWKESVGAVQKSMGETADRGIKWFREVTGSQDRFFGPLQKQRDALAAINKQLDDEANDERFQQLKKLFFLQQELAAARKVSVSPLLMQHEMSDFQQLSAALRKELDKLGMGPLQGLEAMKEAFDAKVVQVFTAEVELAAEAYGLTKEQVDALTASLVKLQAKRKEDSTKSEQAYLDKIKQVIDAQEEERMKLLELRRVQSFDGFNDGVREALEGMQDMETVGKEVADGIRDSFRDTFKDVVRGTFDARKALSSVLDLLLNVFANLASGQLTAGLGGALGFGGARAGGGPVSAGSAYLVGEDGPELFQPPSNGTIVPAGETARAMSSSASVHAPITINISGARDPQATGAEVARQVQAILLDLVSRDQRLRGAIGNQ